MSSYGHYKSFSILMKYHFYMFIKSFNRRGFKGKNAFHFSVMSISWPYLCVNVDLIRHTFFNILFSMAYWSYFIMLSHYMYMEHANTGSPLIL